MLSRFTHTRRSNAVAYVGSRAAHAHMLACICGCGGACMHACIRGAPTPTPTSSHSVHKRHFTRRQVVNPQLLTTATVVWGRGAPVLHPPTVPCAPLVGAHGTVGGCNTGAPLPLCLVRCEILTATTCSLVLAGQTAWHITQGCHQGCHSTHPSADKRHILQPHCPVPPPPPPLLSPPHCSDVQRTHLDGGETLPLPLSPSSGH